MAVLAAGESFFTSRPAGTLRATGRVTLRRLMAKATALDDPRPSAHAALEPDPGPIMICWLVTVRDGDYGLAHLTKHLSAIELWWVKRLKTRLVSH
jgi:hypothetical protein